jgi:hypothetical protein
MWIWTDLLWRLIGSGVTASDRSSGTLVRDSLLSREKVGMGRSFFWVPMIPAVSSYMFSSLSL